MKEEQTAENGSTELTTGAEKYEKVKNFTQSRALSALSVVMIKETIAEDEKSR